MEKTESTAIMPCQKVRNSVGSYTNTAALHPTREHLVSPVRRHAQVQTPTPIHTVHSVRTFPHKYCPVPSKRLSTLLSAVISAGAGSPSKELVTDGCSSEGRKGRSMEEETAHMAILTLHIRNEVNKSCTQSLFPFRLLFGMEIGTGFEGRKKDINN